MKDKKTTIGVVALSSACKEDYTEAGKAYLKEAGCNIRLPFSPSLFYGSYEHLFSAHSIDARVTAFIDLMKDPSVDAIWCARGGYGILEILPLIDPDIFTYKKPIIGFSDATALLLYAYSHGGIAIHGPTICKSINDENKKSLDQTLKMITENLPVEPNGFRLTGIIGGECAGKIIGGNLSTITSLIGTPYMPALRGHILVLEEVNEKPYRIHRMLTQLKLSNALEGIEGVLLGDFIHCEHEHGPSWRAVIENALKPLGVPIYAGFPIGHGDTNLPFLYGTEITIKDDFIEFNKLAIEN